MQSASQPARPGTNGRERQILVVAGSGRSGTSLFTGLTGRLGFHIPKPEVIPDESNPRGFSEPQWAVDFHDELLASVDVYIEDGRPEAWELTGRVAERPRALGRLSAWLEEQFAAADRIVVKDPRLAWFIDLYRIAAAELDADLSVVTLLRSPPEAMRSREIAYGSGMGHTTRMIAWVNMMLGIEARTRDLPRATVHYEDLLDDWRSALAEVDRALGHGMLDRATPEQIDDAATLVDAGLRRSVTEWDELGLPSRVHDLALRTYRAHGRLVGAGAAVRDEVQNELDALGEEFAAYFDECFEVSRTRTSAVVRRERRRAVRRLREDLGLPADGESPAAEPAPGRRLGSVLRRGPRR